MYFYHSVKLQLLVYPYYVALYVPQGLFSNYAFPSPLHNYTVV